MLCLHTHLWNTNHFLIGQFYLNLGLKKKRTAMTKGKRDPSDKNWCPPPMDRVSGAVHVRIRLVNSGTTSSNKSKKTKCCRRFGCTDVV